MSRRIVSGGASAPSRCVHGEECVQHETFGGPAVLSRFNTGPDCHACAAAGRKVKRPSLAGPEPELFGEVFAVCEGCGVARKLGQVDELGTFDALDRFYAKYPLCLSCRQLGRGVQPPH